MQNTLNCKIDKYPITLHKTSRYETSYEQGEAVLRLNVWDWHFDWRFEVYEDGKRIAKPQIKQIRKRDTLYDQMREGVGNGISKHKFLNTSTTDHFIEYTPKNPQAEIRIVATDEFGREYISLTTHIE